MNKLKRLLAFCAAGTAGVASAVCVVGDANSKTTYLTEKTVIEMTQSGTLTVTEPGEIEVLLVGGGGGGGATQDVGGNWYPGGGGGGGGVIHKQAFSVAAGSYEVVIGAGGAVNAGARPLGGDTTITGLGLTAKGGGCGAKCYALTDGQDGASGGGGTANYSGVSKAGRKAVYKDDPFYNLGYDGGSVTDPWNPGGGGGAGSAANGGTGGNGYSCSITGTEVYYAGGGKAPAGKGSAADNGYGGGGASGMTGYQGVVIVSFMRPAGSCGKDFALAGGNKRTYNEDSTIMTFTENGTLTVTGSGSVDVLMVGGGGGGGAHYVSGENTYLGAGGGAGGIVYLKNMTVTPGTYAVTVGAGGAVNENMTGAQGGNSSCSCFNLTAWGGGYGAKGGGMNNATAGGCGGGGTWNWNGSVKRAGQAAGHTAFPDNNIACAGSDATSGYNPGAGGGAGGPADGQNGGIGYLCDITGESLHYAGGGGRLSGGLGGGGKSGFAGEDGLGGGGGPNAKGGSGVVIIRMNKKGYQDKFADATGGKVRRFTRNDKAYQFHTFDENAQFVLPHAGKVELLLVGGGGGGGQGVDNGGWLPGAGGGGGGVIYKESVILEAGTYDIAIGAGGAVNAGARPLGGDTTFACQATAFSLTAKGGGCGAKGGAFTAGMDGASGGGGTMGWSSAQHNPTKAIYTGEPYLNLGNDGGAAASVYSSGGGGGAGTAADGINGGDGYPCSITGSAVYYAGGGKGGGTTGLGGGSNGFGGGGDSGKVGGNGVVVVCHEAPRTGLFLVLR